MTERRNPHRKVHTTTTTEPTEDPTFDEDPGTIKKNKFYVSPFTKNLGPDQYKQYSHRKITLGGLANQAKNPNQNPVFREVVKGQVEQLSNLRHVFRKKSIRSKMAVKELLNVKLNNSLDKREDNHDLRLLQEAADDFNTIIAEKKRIEGKFHPQPGVNTKR